MIGDNLHLHFLELREKMHAGQRGINIREGDGER